MKVDKFETKPIADLFPKYNNYVCGYQGFTAWSSSKEPSGVTLLRNDLSGLR
jgi:hypothetical protein